MTPESWIAYWVIGLVLIAFLAVTTFGVACLLYIPYNVIRGKEPPYDSWIEDTLSIYGTIIWTLLFIFGVPMAIGWLAVVMFG